MELAHVILKVINKNVPRVRYKEGSFTSKILYCIKTNFT